MFSALLNGSQIEEKFIGSYDLPPLRVVGLEGLFGFIMLSILLVVM